MKIAVMQPYFLPYLGYFQLINAVDEFAIYDDIEYTKKGWINRNRLQFSGKEFILSIPIKKSSDYLTVNQRHLAECWDHDKKKLLNKISSNYKNAPYFEQCWPVLTSIINAKEKNLYDFIFNSIVEITQWLNIETNLIITSSVNYNSALKAQDKVIDLCLALNAKQYINPIGGVELYNEQDFLDNGLMLKFLTPKLPPYDQGTTTFLSHLSILDVMMYQTKDEIKLMLNNDFELV